LLLISPTKGTLLAEGVGKKAGESAKGRDGGAGCGGYFPGDGLADDGKGKDAD
jgi:hypothetical protein